MYYIGGEGERECQKVSLFYTYKLHVKFDKTDSYYYSHCNIVFSDVSDSAGNLLINLFLA